MNYNQYVKDDFLVWTMTTNGYKYLTLNLYESLKKSKVSWKLMIVCVDKESYRFFTSMNIQTVFYKSINQIPIGVSPSQFGSDTFMTFNKIKLDLIEKIRLEVPSSVKYITYMDGDIIVFKDFMPYIKEKFSVSDSIILFQNDSMNEGVTTKLTVCSGFLGPRSLD